MEKRATLLSIGLSVLAMYLVWQYISGEDERLKKDYETTLNVVIAKRDILQFETIRPTDITTLSVPAKYLPPGLIVNQEDVYDSVAAIPISKGEYILDNKIISKNVYSGLDTQITRGKRAISVPVNVRSSVGFQLRPGSRVDLAALFEYSVKTKPSVSEVKVFLQDLLVLASGRTIQSEAPKAVDQNIIKGLLSGNNPEIPKDQIELRDTLNYAKTDANYTTVTLEVTPEQAQSITYVMTAYPDSLTLLLRNSEDRTVNQTSTTTLRDVMGPDSWLVKGPKAPTPKSAPRIRFYDYVGGEQVKVYGPKD
ncbi:MAG: Flp pilus assembly protein CpaB [Proteobacteria bacterium]|nr:Flp pilus assembly protein CpaB [Pseudomonadota bacterium]NDC23390.1 Flp pilus assembly protein CpaB [Pseudomonadota bacterium]NDD04862.1 Flp pilus assembly protein CpaB [Pseudomonadota bacterium]NDG27217.1 Flp pilus assembly protein CpaB [Pseudomonadota bacterium]